jgi:hypothetical protein
MTATLQQQKISAFLTNSLIPNMKLPALTITLLSLQFAGSANADEGMWTFDNLPDAQLKSGYNFVADKQWANHVMRAAVSLGGCSASFISPTGLVMTNQHCVAGCLQQISTAQKNYLIDGHLARKPEQEISCPAQEVSRLDAISDVTQAVLSATQNLSGEAYKAAQNQIKAKISSDCVGDKKATVRCSVVSLYQGGQYHLYRYYRYSDVRLVWAPEAAATRFGGDPDNFNFPRFSLDAAMLRAYEDGKPAMIKDFLAVNKNGAAADDLVFAVGTPGRTNRLLTVAELETLRDTRLLERLRDNSEYRGLLTQYRQLGAEQARMAGNDLYGIENGLKVANGQMQALLSPALLARKRNEEEALQQFVAANPTLREKIGNPWLAIANAQLVARSLHKEYNAIEGAAAFQSRYFTHARTLVRGVAARALKDGERLPEFNNTALPQLERQLFSPAPIYPEFEKVKLTFSLTKLREWLGSDDPFVQQVLGKNSPAQVAQQLVEGTKLGEVMQRKTLWNSDISAIEKSNDSFILLARAVDAQARAIRARYENEVTAVEQKNAELIAMARFAQNGTKVYPDATGTLRLSFGKVAGFTERGKVVAPFTTIAGAFARDTGAQPYALSKQWLDAKAKLQLSQSYNFTTNNDIIGGNSGSPMINRNAEIVGLAFDGNAHSFGNAFGFDASVSRTIGVTSGGLLEALKNIYDATELLNEISIK